MCTEYLAEISKYSSWLKLSFWVHLKLGMKNQQVGFAEHTLFAQYLLHVYNLPVGRGAGPGALKMPNHLQLFKKTTHLKRSMFSDWWF